MVACERDLRGVDTLTGSHRSDGDDAARLECLARSCGAIGREQACGLAMLASLRNDGDGSSLWRRCLGEEGAGGPVCA
jgi:hypothetical protein